jgi:ABC-type glycerol-3-phosphate transport system substrate-binding protein
MESTAKHAHQTNQRKPQGGEYCIIFLTCSLLIIALLSTGCTQATPTPQSVLPTPSTTIETTYTSPTVTPTPTREPSPMITTLELWLPEELDPYGKGTGANVMAQQLSGFSRAYPDLQVDVVVKKAHGRGGLPDFLRTAREAAPSVLPDLMILDAADLKAVAGSNLIQPLDDSTAPAAADDRFPFASAMGQVGGQTMGFIIGVDMQHLAYRRDLLDSPPISWTAVISAPAPYIFPAGGYDDTINDATLIQYLGAGGKLTDPEGNPWLDEEVMLSVFDFYSQCITHTVIAPTQVLTLTHVDQAWEQFKADTSGMVAVRAGRYWLEESEDFAAAPIPTKSGRPFSIARGWALTLVTDDPNRQEAASLLFNWLTASEHNAQWTQAAGYLPGTYSALRLWELPDEDLAVLRSIMEGAVPPPRPDLITVIGPAMQEALTDVLKGYATPQEAAAAAAERLNK